MLRVLASFCPHLCHISIDYMIVRGGESPLQLSEVGECAKLLYAPEGLTGVIHHLDGETVFSKLHSLRRVSLGRASCSHDRDNKHHHNRASFIPSLLANNPHLEEVELVKEGFCDIRAYVRHKVLLERRGVRLVQLARENIFDD